MQERKLGALEPTAAARLSNCPLPRVVLPPPREPNPAAGDPSLPLGRQSLRDAVVSDYDLRVSAVEREDGPGGSVATAVGLRVWFVHSATENSNFVECAQALATSSAAA